MPRWDFKCDRCGRVEEMSFVDYYDRSAQVHEVGVYCQAVLGDGMICGGEMRQQPSAPNFNVTGFNAKNGYSK